jgi:IclR family acetate operon transcriptional repressor
LLSGKYFPICGKQMATSKNFNNVNSVIRAGQILHCLSSGINRLSKISEDLQLSISTIHRLLKTLESIGFVIQDPSNTSYYLGPSIFRLSKNLTESHQFLISVALKHMEYLRDLSGETVSLTIRHGLQRIQLKELPSKKELKVAVGDHFAVPIYAGSAGKVLLSEQEEGELKPILKRIELIGIGPNTVTDKDTLFEELRKARSQGYSTSRGEVITGTAAISVPVRGYVCPAALSIIGPEDRFLPKMISILEELKNSAMLISSKLKGKDHSRRD